MSISISSRKFIRKEPPLCACGCGGRVKKCKNSHQWNTYIYTHNNNVRKLSEKTKRKISEANTGKKHSND